MTGRVQGVGYRASAQHAAQQAGVSGWVRNCADGSVEAVLEGPAAAVESVVTWCRRGPRWSEVSDVAVQAETPEGLSGFSVR